MNTESTQTVSAVRGSILHFLDDPGESNDPQALNFFDDGLLIIENGYITKAGPAQDLIPTLPESASVIDRRGKLIVPGFVDCHAHFVQTDIIASWGKRLLDWLEQCTFPAERAFSDPEVCQETAAFFLEEQLRNGTTTSLIMGSVHPQATEALFQQAERRKLRLIAGKVMMDRNCPEYLQDTADSSFEDSKALLERWHGKDRLQYAISPRFAPTSTPEQLQMAAHLAQDYPDAYIHTHLAENAKEIEWVEELFPDSRSYLDVYDQLGLLRKRSLFAHSIWLDDQDLIRLHETNAAIAHCPTSNLFLGSGLFDWARTESAGVKVALATDVGGGDTFSLLRVLNETFKVAQMKGYVMTAERGFYLATLGGAKALDLDKQIGNFEPGKEADFLILDLSATEILARRMERCTTVAEKLFLLMMLGDDRVIAETYIQGKLIHQR